MKTIEMEDDVWLELERRAQTDVLFRGLLKLMRVSPASPSNGATVDLKTEGENLVVSTSLSQREGGIRGQGVRLGRTVRDKYARQYGMIPRGGIVYELDRREVIMPFATEINPNRWFLGAAATVFAQNGNKILILLCWHEGQVLDFVIPPEQLAEILPRLTQNNHGLFMFNVARRDSSHYELLVPNAPRDISKLLHAQEILRRKG